MRRHRSETETPASPPEITKGEPTGTILKDRPSTTPAPGKVPTARPGPAAPPTARPEPAAPPTELPPVTTPPPVIEEPAAAEVTPAIEKPEPTAGRLVRLRTRLSRSQSALGKGLLALISRDHLDEDAWEELEDTLISADVGIDATRELVDRLRERTRVLGTRSAADLRALVTEELVAALDPAMDRSLQATPHGDDPAVVLVVGVNGAGKTTTCGKIARVLVADGHTVVMGAADTFRAAAADQLATWGSRVGAEVVRGPGGRRPGRGGVRCGTPGQGRQGRLRADRHRRPAAEQGRPDGRAGQGQAGGGEAGPGRRDAASPPPA